MSLLSRVHKVTTLLAGTCTHRLTAAAAHTTTRKMHLLQFNHAGRQCIGVRVDDQNIVNLSEFSPDLPTDICSALIANQDQLLSEASRCLQSSASRISVDDITLLPPLTNPGKVICIGLNYRDHCEEVGAKTPTEPVVFNKFSSCVAKSGDIPIPPATKCLDYECELVVVVGKKAVEVKEDDAMSYIFGYTVANDVSARDLVSATKNGGQFLLAKGLDNFCPLSSDIVTKDEIADIHNLNVSTTVNGEVRQCSNTNQLIFNVPQLIAYLSGLFTLLPGDIILTGTPGGTGMGFKPPKYIKSGDVVKVDIQSIGNVTNKFL